MSLNKSFTLLRLPLYASLVTKDCIWKARVIGCRNELIDYVNLRLMSAKDCGM